MTNMKRKTKTRCIVMSVANPQHSRRDLFRLYNTMLSTQLGSHHSSRHLHLRSLISSRTTTGAVSCFAQLASQRLEVVGAAGLSYRVDVSKASTKSMNTNFLPRDAELQRVWKRTCQIGPC
ncbi:hypothetical protein E2C01_091538 [Portunus trituberculatus]|uniref:Uncharacterized protein n=1 Tax=Portunus trituberculatus TaxID=210409 RepID=A0A5B7JT50_PORTR|nr:hypothetical protein [Portunus trituberculatus]